MFEHFKCDKCGESYKGKFVFTLNGTVECFNCKDKVYVDSIKWEEMNSKEGIDELLLRDMFETMLIDDLGQIYMTEAEMGESYDEQFIDENGEAKLDKVYFQHNPVDIVIEGQKIAYSALRYLEGNDKRFREHAKKLVETYKGLRERKLSDSEVTKVWELYFSENTMDLMDREFE